jgi:hypothetical protein
MNGDELREALRSDFEEIGVEVGMEARTSTGWDETAVTFETEDGYQHHFYFPPTWGEDEQG